MSKIDTLLENETVQTMLSDNTDVISETEAIIGDFSKVMKSFVIAHPKEFIAESLEETYKNIRVFTEVATSQFIHEVTTIAGNLVANEEVVAEQAVADYI